MTVENNMIWNIRGWKTAMSFDNLLNSRIINNIYRFQNLGGKNPQKSAERHVLAQLCRWSTIATSKRELVEVKTLKNSVIEASEEDGIRRKYLGSATSGAVLNLTPVNTATLKGMKPGDIAIDDGTNTKSHQFGLAVFDGKHWQYMN